MKKLFSRFILVIVVVVAAGVYWASQPILPDNQSIVEFTITPGSGASSAAREIANAGAPLDPYLFTLFVRSMRQGGKIKAGSYELKPGVTPRELLRKLVNGEFAQKSLTIIEGWTFRQMRQAIFENPGLKHDTTGLSDAELMSKISTQYTHPEGLFFPDTYLFPKGASDMVIYQQAFASMRKHLDNMWARRDLSLPYQSPYEALIMASIVEKETGQKSERGLVAGVFVNRLKVGMLLQTDPTVIYGMGEQYQGRIYKKDLLSSTPYNTYLKKGLPPTPISLPGAASLEAAMHPDPTHALYFVARGDGTSHFSTNLSEHNQAVNLYQR